MMITAQQYHLVARWWCAANTAATRCLHWSWSDGDLFRDDTIPSVRQECLCCDVMNYDYFNSRASVEQQHVPGWVQEQVFMLARAGPWRDCRH